MFDWLTGIVGEDAAPFATYLLIFLVLLIGFFVLRWILRLLRGGTFIHGGHGRKQRLAIVDATPVDNRRRLVLLRRDNVEHLVLIGGMNDLVVERDIGAPSSAKEEPPAATPAPASPKEKRDQASKPAEPAPVPTPEPRQIAKEPEPLSATNTPKVESPSERKTPKFEATQVPVKTKTGNAAAPVAAAAVASLSKNNTTEVSEQKTVEPGEPVLADAGPLKDPMVGRFSAYAENESNAPEPTIEIPEPVDQTKEVKFDDFMPINAPSPSLEPSNELTTGSASQTEEDDSDLEDEMEQLLNKLTKPSQL